MIIEKILLQRPRVRREHDIFQQFKKDCEVLLSEHMAALNIVTLKSVSAMYEPSSPDVAENAARSMAVKMEVGEYMTKCLKEAQRTISKRFEAELSLIASLR